MLNYGYLRNSSSNKNVLYLKHFYMKGTHSLPVGKKIIYCHRLDTEKLFNK